MLTLKFFLGKYAKVSVEEAQAAEAEEEEGENKGKGDKKVGQDRRKTMYTFKKGPCPRPQTPGCIRRASTVTQHTPRGPGCRHTGPAQTGRTV